MRSIVFIFRFFSFFALFSVSLFAQQAFNSSVENEGANCEVTLPSSFNTSNSKLPDPFTKLNGERISSKEEWKCRRQEINSLLERTVYGTKPTTAVTTGTITKNGTNGTITVNVSDNGKNISFSANITYPSGSGPFPAVILYGNSGANGTNIRNAGIATINYTPTTVGQETGSGATGRSTKKGVFYDLYGSNSKTGTLMAWAWGVSRIIDVIESEGGTNLIADAIGVSGCSRYGKGSFAAGVFDQRVALTMPMESGSGGVPAFRSIITESDAQSPSNAYGEQPWLGDDFSSFQSNANIPKLPVDQHEAVAMIAPRGLFIMDNPHVEWLATKSGHVATLGGIEVYKALEVEENVSYHSNVSDGTHCAWRSDWNTLLENNLKKFLLKTDSAAGVVNVYSSAKGNLSSFIDWTTPTLSDEYASGDDNIDEDDDIDNEKEDDNEDPITLAFGNAPLKSFSVRSLSNGILQVESNANTTIYMYDIKGNLALKKYVHAGSNIVQIKVPGLYVLKNAASEQTQMVLVK